MRYQVTSSGRYSLVIEADSEADAKVRYEAQRGLVADLNPIEVVALGLMPIYPKPKFIEEPIWPPVGPAPLVKVEVEEVLEVPEVIEVK